MAHDNTSLCWKLTDTVVKSLLKKMHGGCASLLHPPDAEDLARSLEHWYRSPVGERLLAMEREHSVESLRLHPGFRAMLLQVTRELDLLGEGPQLHKFAVTNLSSADCSAISDFDALPLPSGTIDVVLMHHVLDFCEFPHEALKEAARVVTPSGHLVVFGFNPFSWMGLAKWPMRLGSRNLLWRCRMLGGWRVGDWLRLLGFQVEEVDYGCFAPPLQSRRLLGMLHRGEKFFRKTGLPFGSYYMIIARKQVARPIASRKPAWLARGISPVKLGESASVGHRRGPRRAPHDPRPLEKRRARAGVKD